MTSVALCTYNGGKYIEEQISSILNQSVPVDEIVVCDDGSTDNTLTLIEKFQCQTITNIHIYRNEHQLGVCANFQKAINLCKGDIIFLSDQDDVWHRDKVEVICKWFDKHPTKNVVFTNANLIDDKGRIFQNDSLWNRVGFSRKECFWFNIGLGIEVFMRGNVSTGATMAVRKINANFLSYTKDQVLFHDEVIAEIALIKNELGLISSRLIDYRLHDHQVCGMPYSPIIRISAVKPSWNTSRLAELPFYEKVKERCDFGQTRLVSKHSWFGMYALLNLRTYLHIYGVRCGVFVIGNDIIDSYNHSITRIVNRFKRSLGYCS